jgi:hypothetical protein
MLERRKSHLALLCVATAALWLCPSNAAAGQDRVALAFKEERCASRMDELITRMRGLQAVKAVDTSSVPGHVLVDIERGQVSAEELEAFWNRSTDDLSPCRVEIMKSCITANRASANP